MVTSGSVILKKDGQNLVGISIGGGAPLCPCLYIVQVRACIVVRLSQFLAHVRTSILLTNRKSRVSYAFDVLQVFDGTPAAKEGTLQSGDEVVGVSGQNVKGRTKVEVAKLIQSVPVCLCLVPLIRGAYSYFLHLFSYIRLSMIIVVNDASTIAGRGHNPVQQAARRSQGWQIARYL